MNAELFGFNIDTLYFGDALTKARTLINSDNVSQVITINPEMFIEAEKNKAFADIIKNAEMIIPDGIGVKIALMLNCIKSERVPGIDFAKKLLEYAAEKNFSTALIGSEKEVITKAVENLKADIPNINIVYSSDGYFSDDTKVYNELAKANPQLILIGLGSPRQEFFISEAKKYLNRGLMIGIGGSLDVWSGNVIRAPKIFQKTGTEWLYRTITQPKRFKRIFPTLPLFVLKALKYRFSKKRSI